MYSISQLYIYPVKSLGGIAVSEALLTDRGFQYDRRWMLVDANNQFLTQREHPVMALLQTAIVDNQLNVFHKYDSNEKLELSLQPSVAQPVVVKVWNDFCEAQFVSIDADAWFSRHLKIPCRIVYMPDNSFRYVDKRYAFNDELSSFSDDYPLLMIGEASLADLNSRLEQPLLMDRFRPNIVFAGGDPYSEDRMEHFVINDIDFFGVKLCARCAITTTNQQTAERGKEPLKTLATYRSENNKINFGQNVLYNKSGRLAVGDIIEIERWKA